MAKFTFLEVHLEGSSLTANAPSGLGDGASESTESAEPLGTGEEGGAAADEASGSRRGVAAVVGLAFLVVVALAVRRFLGGEGETIEL